MRPASPSLLFLLLVLFVSCSPRPLDPSGSLQFWSERPDFVLGELAAATPGLRFSVAPKGPAWLVKTADPASAAPDLMVVEFGPEIETARKAGLLADLGPYRARLRSPALMHPALRPRASPFVFLPSSVSVWGLFYNPSLFAKLALAPPGSWAVFLSDLDALKKAGLTPIALGSSFAWPALAWFSALDLRLNGAEAHRRLLEGGRSFSDPGLAAVYATLVEWRDRGFFDPEASTRNWPEALAEVAAGRAGFVLLGSFGLTRVTDPGTLAFLPLPEGPAAALPRGELVSLQGFVLSSKAPFPEAALALADAAIAAGSRGQTEEAFRSAVLPTKTGTDFQKLQEGLLTRAVFAAPLLDRALGAEEAAKADLIAVRFFAPGSRFSAEELGTAFRALGP